MRRLALLFSLVAVVATTGTAAGSVDRTPKSVVEQALLKVRPAPDLAIARPTRGNRVRVIMELEDPPLAAATYARGLAGLGVRQKLNMRSAFSRTYLSTLEAEQARAIADLHDAMPDALVSRRYQVLVNGFAVSVPYARLPKLLDTRIATKVYPSYSYHLNLNRGPSVLGAPQFSALRRAPRGQGVKVAVVDDGVDHEHPFLDPTGFSYPPGFPKGTSGLDDAKGDRRPRLRRTRREQRAARPRQLVPRNVRRRRDRRRQDRRRGRAARASAARRTAAVIPRSRTSRASRPRAYIGNYRVFNVPAPAPLGGCCSANSPEIVAAFEAAVRDGMDVINFSGGGPQADPRTDILIEAVRNVVRAGVVPVISAGNDRDFFGLGTAGSPATAPDAISVGAVANAHVFGASRPGRRTGRTSAHAVRRPPTPCRLLDLEQPAARGRRLDCRCQQAAVRLPRPRARFSGAIALVSRGGVRTA